ncbi:phytanoyl-CoA dioxygenase family protein [Armatimonas sp.]|uniref:phytanoyl-CoA dioxygenase family protein n=1 Tax=Armatimonas sp. TaxID=1872638 RepID=UPI003752C72F
MVLTDEQQATFHDQGFLVFPRYFTDDELVGYKADMDVVQAQREAKKPSPYLCQLPHLGKLIVHPKTLSIVEEVMGPGFAFHHLHASRQGAGTPGSNWHQDYEQEPQTNRSHGMVHVFYYFNGLNGEVGDLVVLPRTQKTVIANGALSHLGQQVLPGEIVVDNLPPGSAVLVYSALWHARRAKPGGEDRVRYFADASYCQAGVKWPSYHNVQWREILAAARENLGHESLFAEEHFFDVRAGKAAWRERQGSLVLDILPTV